MTDPWATRTEVSGSWGWKEAGGTGLVGGGTSATALVVVVVVLLAVSDADAEAGIAMEAAAKVFRHGAVRLGWEQGG